MSNVTHWVPQRDLLARSLFLPAVETKVVFKISAYGGARKGNRTPGEKLDCSAVLAKASVNSWGALELKWSHRVVPNRCKEARPLYIPIYQPLDVD